MNTKMNQRRLATIEKIETAFISLLQTKSVREISVTDICTQAEINRSTFYENYSNVSAVAVKISRRIEEDVARIPHDAGKFIWLFEHVSAHKDVFDVYFRINAPLDSTDYKSAYLRNGIYAVVKAWYEAGCLESAEAMDQLLKKIIHRREN